MFTLFTLSAVAPFILAVAGIGGPGGVKAPPKPAGPGFKLPPAAPKPPKAPTTGLSGGYSLLDRKLRVDRNRFLELAADAELRNGVVKAFEVAGRPGDRLELDLAAHVAGAWTFEAVAGTTIEIVARIEGGRGAARLKFDSPTGGRDEDVIVVPGKITRFDSILAVSTGIYRVELLPMPGDSTGKVVVTTSAKPPVDKPRTLALDEGRPTELVVQGMPGRALRSFTWSVPKTDSPPRPFVDLQSPSGKITRLDARIVDGSPTRVVLEDVALDELGAWTLRFADLSRASRAGELKLAFTEPPKGRELVRFE